MRNMMGLTREEKENLVLDLYYNQGKTYAEIAKEARISLRDIGPILKNLDQSNHCLIRLKSIYYFQKASLQYRWLSN